MKGKNFIRFAVFMLVMFLTACTKAMSENVEYDSSGQIYLYGEVHGNKLIFERELELWKQYYDEQGMRHLFVEVPYYTAEFLNLWMAATDDTILNELYQDWEGTVIHTEETLEFFKGIKQQCSETVFHGTDVGHQYYSTGERYLTYLIDNNMDESEQYALTNECIEQGKKYYNNSDDVYRENAMASNFIREFDALNGANVMGIYGAAHTSVDANDYKTGSVPCMGKQLYERYGENLFTEDLSAFAWNNEGQISENLSIGGKTYETVYYGKMDLSAILPEYQYREFWLIKNAYEDFKDCPTVGNVLPYNNYIMTVEVGQIYLVKYTLTFRYIHL